LSTSGESKTSPALTQDPSVGPSVPYMSARVFKSPWCIEFGGAMQMDQRELDEFPSASKQNKSQCYLWSFSKKKKKQ
ncbi:unnamed protein product, partial [Brassica rapa subsp. trilocularis]